MKNTQRLILILSLFSVAAWHAEMLFAAESSNQRAPVSLKSLFIEPPGSQKHSLDSARNAKQRAAASSQPSLATAKQWEVVQLNPAVLTEDALVVGDSLKVSLFDEDITVSISSVTEDVNGVISIAGEIIGEAFSHAYLTIKDNELFAYFELPESGREFRVNKADVLSEPVFILQEVDLEKKDIIESQHLHDHEHSNPERAPLLSDWRQEHKLTDDGLFRQNTESSRSGLEEATIDVLVVYTRNAVRRLELEGLSMEFAISAAMERANVVLRNSNISARVRLVASKGINYLERGSCHNILGELREATNGLEFVADWRNEHQADIVSMFLDIDNDCGGVAYTLSYHPEDWPYGRSSNVDAFRAERGFNLIRVAQAYNSYTFAHEFGHNLGAGHHPDQVSPTGKAGEGGGPTRWQLYDYDLEEWFDDPNRLYSAGWRWSNPLADEPCCVTVMSYNSGEYYDDGEDRVQIPYFSSPKVSKDGFATGDAVRADNARTLNETAHFVSRYDEILGLNGQVTLAPVFLQGGLSGSWFDPERNGEGFLLEFTQNSSDNLVTVYWFTYDDGRPYWLFGATSYQTTDDKITVELSEVNGPSFGADFDSSEVSVSDWGEIELQFSSCQKARAEWRSDEGEQGSFDLQRIVARLADAPCID